MDGIISVEAAFHFRSREAFFAGCYRVLRPGGVLSISDISAQRWPVTPAELLAGLTQPRVFGLRRTMAVTAGQIAAEARAAGLAEVQVRRCGDRVIAPALRLTAERLKDPDATFKQGNTNPQIGLSAGAPNGPTAMHAADGHRTHLHAGTARRERYLGLTLRITGARH